MQYPWVNLHQDSGYGLSYPIYLFKDDFLKLFSILYRPQSVEGQTPSWNQPEAVLEVVSLWNFSLRVPKSAVRPEGRGGAGWVPCLVLPSLWRWRGWKSAAQCPQRPDPRTPGEAREQPENHGSHWRGQQKGILRPQLPPMPGTDVPTPPSLGERNYVRSRRLPLSPVMAEEAGQGVVNIWQPQQLHPVGMKKRRMQRASWRPRQARA